MAERERNVLVEQVLRRAGWFEGRDMLDQFAVWREHLRQDRFEPSKAAEAALREFGGIAVTRQAAGVDLAIEPFQIDPTVASGERDRFERFEPLIGQAIYPIGECGSGRFFLGVAPDGRVFAIADAISLVGESVQQALVNLIVGIRGAELDLEKLDLEKHEADS